ncbi:unnamed protein product [Moneuplotes crassus]|uniref:Uncharacterized protein n=1 Tax=Euplotes crassus TaxID=5936 RepID=A0AAD1U2Q3_EUPCR|nr:unnamed protein product [Moneuplotes crassus]
MLSSQSFIHYKEVCEFNEVTEKACCKIKNNFKLGNTLKLPTVMAGKGFSGSMPSSPVSYYKDKSEKFEVTSFQTRKTSKVEKSSIIQPASSILKFYSTQIESDIDSMSNNIADAKEDLDPIDKNNKELQDHFVSMCDRNNQFLFSNSSLTRQSFKSYLSKRYCKNVVEKLLSIMNFPQTASYNIFCRLITQLLEMSPIEKMKMAFVFYAHKYDDKITALDAFSMMSHLSQFDFLILQRDIKEIFKGLAKVKQKRNEAYSSRFKCKSMERKYAEFTMAKTKSPEKKLEIVPSVAERREMRSSKDKGNIPLRKMANSVRVSPKNKGSFVSQYSGKSPTKSSVVEEGNKTLKILRRNFHKT